MLFKLQPSWPEPDLVWSFCRVSFLSVSPSGGRLFTLMPLNSYQIELRGFWQLKSLGRLSFLQSSFQQAVRLTDWWGNKWVLWLAETTFTKASLAIIPFSSFPNPERKWLVVPSTIWTGQKDFFLICLPSGTKTTLRCAVVQNRIFRWCVWRNLRGTAKTYIFWPLPGGFRPPW